jgi:hypothetical protein
MTTKSGLNKSNWDEIKSELRHILIGLAKMGKTIFYSDLARQVTSAHIHHRAPAFDHILQDLCADEIAEGRPILGVVVVNKATGRCGDGFYKWASAQGYDTHDSEAFWQAEFARVVDYWQNSD